MLAEQIKQAKQKLARPNKLNTRNSTKRRHFFFCEKNHVLGFQYLSFYGVWCDSFEFRIW